MNKLLGTSIISLGIAVAGCSDGGGTGSSAVSSSSLNNYKIVAASINPTDRGLVTTKNNLSAMSVASRFIRQQVSAQSSLADNLIRVAVDGTISNVTFTVVDQTTGESSEVSIPIMATKTLTDNYIGLKIFDSRVGILNKSTGDVYDLPNVSFDEMQMNSTNLYALTTTRQLFRVDVTDPDLIIHNINDVNGVASNTGFPTAIYSTLNDSSSPFRFLAFNQKAGDSGTSSPSYVFAQNYLLAMSGPQGGRRVMLFQEGQQTFDCNMQEMFTNVGGGGTGGVIQTADQSLYQIQLVTDPVASNYGDSLIKYNLGKYSGTNSDSCWGAADTTVMTLGPSSHFPSNANANIYYKVNYNLNDVERYLVNSSGFIHTNTDGNNGLVMSWTALNLSDIPTAQDATTSYQTGGTQQLVVLEGNYIYYLKNNAIYYQQLSAGSSKALFYSGQQIDTFDIVAGQLIFSNTTGTYNVPTPGAAESLIGENISLTNALKF